MNFIKYKLNRKASGFGTVVGFMFSFMIMIGVVTFVFFTMIEDAKSKSELIEISKDLSKSSAVSFNIDEMYYDNGRLRIFVENDGRENIFFKKGSSVCVDLFVNDIYISGDKFDVYVNSPLGNYYVLTPGDIGVIDIDIDVNISENVEVDLITCGNYKESFVYQNSSFNWLNYDYKERSFFLFENSDPDDLRNFNYEIELNTSNFDFGKATEDEIQFLLPIYENTVLNLNFDDYLVSLIESSRYSNLVYLGFVSLVESDDPSEVEGIFIDALSYDGLDDYNRIVNDNSLVFRNSSSFSLWFKWNGPDGVTNDTLFRLGNNSNELKIVGDGSTSDSKVVFSLFSGGAVRELTSTTFVNDSSWHNVVGTFNSTYQALYIDGVLEDSSSFSYALLNVSQFDNQIGSSNSTNFFNGTIDDLRVLNIDLNSSQVLDLFSNQLRYVSLDFVVNEWDKVNQTANISVEIPFVFANDNITFELYYYLFGDSYQTNP